MKVEIEFVRDIVGHDIATIQQMYEDWSGTQQKNISANGVDELLNEALKHYKDMQQMENLLKVSRQYP